MQASGLEAAAAPAKAEQIPLTPRRAGGSAFPECPLMGWSQGPRVSDGAELGGAWWGRDRAGAVGGGQQHSQPQ